MREAIRGYRSEGLAAEIDRARKILDAAGVTLECEAKPPQFPPAEETVLSLIVREAVTNIVRHAQASHCRAGFSDAMATARLLWSRMTAAAAFALKATVSAGCASAWSPSAAACSSTPDREPGC